MQTTKLATLLSLFLCFTVEHAVGQIQVASSDIAQHCKQMGLALGRYIADGEVGKDEQCDKLLDDFLARHDLTSDYLQAAAQIARLRKRPKEAISAIERAIAEYPDATFPSLALPGRIVGQIWIASIARQNGDLQRARTAFEAVMKDIYALGEGEENKSFRMGVCLLQADCLVGLGDTESAKRILRAMPVVRNPNMSPFEWATYYSDNLEKGVEATRRGRHQTPILRKLSLPIAQSFLTLNGVNDFPSQLTFGDYVHDRAVRLYSLRQSVEAKQSGVERELAMYCLGMEYLAKSNDLTLAKSYFDGLCKMDSFFSPESGLRLLECAKREQIAGKPGSDYVLLVQELKTRFPGYSPAIDEVGQAPLPSK